MAWRLGINFALFVTFVPRLDSNSISSTQLPARMLAYAHIVSSIGPSPMQGNHVKERHMREDAVSGTGVRQQRLV